MEASQSQDPQTPADAQEQPTQDSGLITPQPDQPVPTEAERQAQAEAPPTDPELEPTDGPDDGSQLEGYKSKQQYPSNADQEAAQEQKESELAAARQEHNDRTGGGTVNDGEVQAARDEHNARTGGGVQQAEAVDSDDGSQDSAA